MTDMDVSKIKDDILDEDYVVSSRIRTGRNLKGFCLSPFICRAERRKVESLVSSGKSTSFISTNSPFHKS